MSVLIALIIIVANFITGHLIDYRQEQSIKVGKMRQSVLIITTHSLTFIALVNYFGTPAITVWAAIVALGFIIPFFQLPYNGRYNFNFAKGWHRYRTIRHWTYAAAFACWLIF